MPSSSSKMSPYALGTLFALSWLLLLLLLLMGVPILDPFFHSWFEFPPPFCHGAWPSGDLLALGGSSASPPFCHGAWASGDPLPHPRPSPVLSQSCPGLVPVLSQSCPGLVPVLSRSCPGLVPVLSTLAWCGTKRSFQHQLITWLRLEEYLPDLRPDAADSQKSDLAQKNPKRGFWHI